MWERLPEARLEIQLLDFALELLRTLLRPASGILHFPLQVCDDLVLLEVGQPMLLGEALSHLLLDAPPLAIQPLLDLEAQLAHAILQLALAPPEIELDVARLVQLCLHLTDFLTQRLHLDGLLFPRPRLGAGDLGLQALRQLGLALLLMSRHPPLHFRADGFLVAVCQRGGGRVLSAAAHEAPVDEPAGTLDDVTTYYLLHRNDFGLDDAPAGACILYALSCNVSESDLADRYDILVRTGGSEETDEREEEEAADADEGVQEGTGSAFRLKSWKQRTRPGMGVDQALARARRQRERAADAPYLPALEPPEPVVVPRQVPVIDQAHRLMHFWRAGDVARVNEYVDDRDLRRNTVFQQLLQALIELAPQGSEERSLLESIMNHVQSLGVDSDRQLPLAPEGA